ncbi:glutathione S-transferase [Marinobacter halodurans]|uniref:Glutathione S-transferase n=1 Tax=Marinobacter halodurans TaxID=2528979 RepID=A0ABY1ZE67_9GAMM|nr:glutathione S-transferase [Marinobacter halodurans]TBW48124.1 glutathione S-transferase [Marinobacter halodurans]
MPIPDQPIRLHQHPLSGHSHRVTLFLNLLGLPYEAIEVDLLRGDQKTPAFLALNPFAQVPVIEDGTTVLPDSNAILVYLAKRYDAEGWLPDAPEAAARVQRWLSVAAGQLVSGPAIARVSNVFGRQADLDQCAVVANRLFPLMENELADRQWLADTRPTLADVAMYSYTAHAPEGGISLEPYPQIRAWLERIESLPGFIPMPRTPVGLQAAESR